MRLIAWICLSLVQVHSIPHGGDERAKLREKAGRKQPHILMVLFDDYGWANAGWHRDYVAPGGEHVPATPEVETPNLNTLVEEGINLDRNYVYKYCSPTRSALQSGRNPYHVNPINAAPDIHNPGDPVSGFAAIPRNMTGIATKMKEAGYKTAAFGKWDAGMATPDHTPRGRGYDIALNYFHHCNDYWSMAQSSCPPTNHSTQGMPPQNVIDLWLTTQDSEGKGSSEGPASVVGTDADSFTTYGRPALGLNNTCVGAMPQGVCPGNCKPGSEGDDWWGGYEDSLFEQHVLQTIREHDPSVPLFLFWAPHIVHEPLQVPKTFLDKFAFMADTDKPTHERQLYHAMVNFADTMVGNVTSLFKEKGMWDDLVIVFSADNGGPIYNNGTAGANNYPLKGGKMNNWEGGIRVNGFVSGGFLPKSVRGTTFDGLVAAWDWYHTFASLAGVDATDTRAAAAGLPPIDSYDMSPVLLGKTAISPRRHLVIGTEPRESNVSTAPLCIAYNAKTPYYDDPRVDGDEPLALPDPEISVGRRCTTVSGLILDERQPDGSGSLWKLLTGKVEQDVYMGPHYPNSTTDVSSALFVHRCGNGCLFDLEADPLEAQDVASTNPHKVAELYGMVVEAEKTAFNPDRGTKDPKACEMVWGRYGGFWGPFVDV